MATSEEIFCCWQLFHLIIKGIYLYLYGLLASLQGFLVKKASRTIAISEFKKNFGKVASYDWEI